MFEHMRKGTLNMSVLQAWATTQLRQNSYLVSLYELVELQESWQSTWRLGALGGWYYGWNFYFWGKVWEFKQTEQKKPCYRPISMPGYGRECPELPGNAQGSPGEAGNFQLVGYNHPTIIALGLLTIVPWNTTVRPIYLGTPYFYSVVHRGCPDKWDALY